MKSSFIFLAGTLVGAASMYIYMYKKHVEPYDIVEPEEVTEEAVNDTSVDEPKTEEPIVNHSSDSLGAKRDAERTDYSAIDKNIIKEETKPETEIIPENEYAMEDDYECTTVWYLADGMLVDDYGEEINPSLVGVAALDYLEAHEEEDAVYVRNNIVLTDYEVLRDLRVRDEFRKVLPYRERDDD